MELIVISHTKIKIMLAPMDMKLYELSPCSLDASNERTRSALRRILADADRESGFDTEGERLFVQLYASKDGGCEIFVTKLGKNTDTSSSADIAETRLLATVQESESNDETEKTMSVTNHSPALPASGSVSDYTSLPLRNSTMVFLDDLTALISLCRRFLNAGFGGDSRAYIHESGTACYLYLREGESMIDLGLIYPFVSEYGHTSTDTAWALYVEEHARVISRESAIETLGIL